MNTIDFEGKQIPEKIFCPNDGRIAEAHPLNESYGCLMNECPFYISFKKYQREEAEGMWEGRFNTFYGQNLDHEQLENIRDYFEKIHNPEKKKRPKLWNILHNLRPKKV